MTTTTARARAATHASAKRTASRAPSSAIALAERRAYQELLHAVQLSPALAMERDEFSMTPLHWICTDPQVPIRVLQNVVLAYPEATTLRNLAGLLPLHLAVRKDLPLDALKTLLKFYPKAVIAETPDGKTAKEIAQQHVTSRSAKVFLHLLDQEVRALGPSAAGPSKTDSRQQSSSEDDPAEHSEVDVAPWSADALQTPGDADATAASHADSGDQSVRAPEWRLSKNCHICFVKFGYFRNRHHCRNCGESVCRRHSKRFVPLPHFGLFRSQRVCDSCHEELQSFYSVDAMAILSPRHRRQLQDMHPRKNSEAFVPLVARPQRSRSAVDVPSQSTTLLLPSPALSSRSNTNSTSGLLSRETASTQRSAATSNTSSSSSSAVSSAKHPNFIKLPSTISMHLVKVQKPNGGQTVEDRRREMEPTHHDLGVVLLAKKDFGQAVKVLRQAVTLCPTNPQAWYHLAKALDGDGEAAEAEDAIQQSLALVPDSLPGLSLLGKLLNARGEHEAAIAVFRRALRLQC
ncbi:hypothetical protein ATCC90586_002367 [Pythium insidiosum]|nr:hypothetical protein ATCC90586_002367 [Pythium insidiosum]